MMGKDHSPIPSLKRKQAIEVKGIIPELFRNVGNSIIKTDKLYLVLSLYQAEFFQCIISFNAYILII